MSEQQRSFVAGLSLPSGCDDASALLQAARRDGYDFVTTRMPDFKSTAPNTVTPTARSDVVALESKWWSTSIVGSVLPDPSLSLSTTSTCSYGEDLVARLNAHAPMPAKEAEHVLEQMVEWAAHMSIPAIILPPLAVGDHNVNNDSNNDGYARVLHKLCTTYTHVQLWVRTPLTPASLAAFDVVHRRCDGAPNLGLLLDFLIPPPIHLNNNNMTPVTSSPGSPSNANANANATSLSSNISTSMALVHLACGRNCKAVSFPTSLFLTNKRGYPTLSKSHQMLFTELLRRLGRTLRVLVEGAPLHLIGHRNDDDDDNRSSGTQCLAYLQYLKHLRARPEVAGVIDTPEAIMETNYLDHLQAPLQPLGDNLEFQTYETFEKDPVKYRQYALAVELAIQDLLRIQEKSSPKPAISTNANVKSTIPPTRVIRIMVLGAGRGPLVRSALQAIGAINRKAGRTVVISQILAVEKNPSAVLYLQSVRARDPMWACVTVVSGDMRTIPQTNPVVANLLKEGIQADVMVSELLGSFGCNELSPECLDGAYECMAGLISKDASKTICIPERYSSFLAPVSSMKLYSEARAQSYTPYNAADGPAGMPAGSLRAFETPYVVRTHAAAQTHAEQFCWEFQHPASPSPSSSDTCHTDATTRNERYVKLTFSPDASHGAGSGCGYGAFDKTVAGMASQELAGTPNMGPSSSSSSRPSRTPQSVTIHGFLGTFDSILYKSKHVTSSGPTTEATASTAASEARISIVPSTFSTGMFSWFPLYFPLKEPMVVPSGATLEASMWRRMEGTKVWYEWCAQVILSRPPSSSPYQDPPIVLSASAIHNPNGRSCHVRL